MHLLQANYNYLKLASPFQANFNCFKLTSTMNHHTWQKGGCFWPSDLVDDVVWRPSTMFGFGLLLRILENWSFHSRARLWQNTISLSQLTFKVNTQANTSHVFSNQSQVCCALVYSNDRSMFFFSRAIMKDSKIAQRNFNFPKVVHINHCPRK